MAILKSFIRIRRRNRHGGAKLVILTAFLLLLGLFTFHKIITKKQAEQSLTLTVPDGFNYYEYDEDSTTELLNSTTATISTSTFAGTTTIERTASSKSLSSSVSCVIPALVPKISLVPKKTKPISCSRYPENPVYSLKGQLIVEPTIKLRRSNNKTIACSYKPITFNTDFKIDVGENVNLTSGIHPCPAENMFVSCSHDGNRKKILFESTMRCIYQKKEVISRINNVLSSATISPTGEKPATKIFRENLNILMVGFDGVSHVGWLEQLPMSTSFFQKTLGGVIFDGYNIIGDGTTQAILALTTGYMEEELHESRRGFLGASEIEDYPFIWRQLTDQAGYATLWDEEQSKIGTFQYRLLGFRWPPVDYYGRPFRMYDEDKTRQRLLRDADCYGSMKHFDEQFNLVDRFFEAYPDPLRKFALVFSSLYSHTCIEEGDQELERLDSDFLQVLKRHYSNGFYNDSVLILFSDHGSRFSGSRATQRGKIEERLPFFGVAFPEWFRKKYPNEMTNFVEVSKRLTTPFDVHATLLDIAGLQPMPGTPNWGISFFKPHPPKRMCADAGVLPHWCVCLSQDNKISVNEPLVKKCLSVFEKTINEQLLADFIKADQCEHVSVVKAFAANRFALRSEVATFVGTIDRHGRYPSFDNSTDKHSVAEEFVQVSFTTSPGNGQWEATFTHYLKSGDVTLGVKQISRTNKYGSAPWCVQDSFPHLRPFCYCKRKMPEEGQA